MSNRSVNDASPETEGAVALVLGPLAAVGVAAFLAGFRDDVGSANVVLVLSIVVTIAALAGRAAGVVTAVVAAMSYNFFHTVPYHSLRINAVRDVVTVLILIVLGVIVSETSAWRRRIGQTSARRLRAARALEEMAALLSRGAEPTECWSVVHSATIDVLDLQECRYEAGSASTVDHLSRSGSLVSSSMRFGTHGFELPPGGVAVEVRSAEHVFGSIVLVPKSRSGSKIEDRQAALAFADLYAVCLDQHSKRPLARLGE